MKFTHGSLYKHVHFTQINYKNNVPHQFESQEPFQRETLGFPNEDEDLLHERHGKKEVWQDFHHYNHSMHYQRPLNNH